MTDAGPVLSRPRPWANPKWVAAVAALIGAVSLASWAASSISTSSEVGDQGQVLERLESIATDLGKLAEQNAVNIDQLEANQAGIDELVAFVRDLQAEAEDEGEDETVRRFLVVLCASSDPARIAVCDELRAEGLIP